MLTVAYPAKWRLVLELIGAALFMIASFASRLYFFPDWRAHPWSVSLDIGLMVVSAALFYDARRLYEE